MKKIVAVGKIGPVDNEAARPIRIMELQWLDADEDQVRVELATIPQNRKDA